MSFIQFAHVSTATHSSFVQIDPVMGAPPRQRVFHLLWRLHHLVRGAFGLRRSFRVDGVYYKETSTLPLYRAIAGERGVGGAKEYRVTFPDGSKQYISCTYARVYADPMGAVLLPMVQVAAGMIRPGCRVLCLPGGTGYAPEWLARIVGRSGSVVSIDPDQESVLYAQRRYQAQNIAFERGGIESLRGELDGSFDAVLSVHRLFAEMPEAPGSIPAVDAEGDRAILRELWRVTRPGGFLFVGRCGITPAELLHRLRSVACFDLPALPGEAPAFGVAPVEVLSSGSDPARDAPQRSPSNDSRHHSRRDDTPPQPALHLAIARKPLD